MATHRRSDEDFSEEIRAHIALETDRLIEEGMPPEEAARTARRRFGNVTAATERFYESRRRRWFDEIRQDFAAARRSLVRYPVVSIVAVLSLGAGIGATAAALTIRDVFFRNPPPLYAEPQQLSKIQVNRQDRPILPFGSFVPADLFTTWRRAVGGSVAAADSRDGISEVRIGDRVEPTRIRAVTANLFDVLGVRPAVGRGFSADGDAGRPTAILSYRLWQEWFAGRAAAVDATIFINGQPHTVIGVMPRRFWFTELNDPVWTLLDPRRLEAGVGLNVVARRPDGTSADALAASLRPALAEYSRRLPPGHVPLKLRVSEIKGTPIAEQMALLLPYVLGAAVLLTLLIACANVAILMIAQWTRREAETAVRSALGASRGRLVRALLAESLLVAASSGALGIGTTYALRAIMLRNAPLADSFVDLSIRPGVLITTMAIALAAGLVAGIGPALIETRRLQTDPLRGIATSDRVRQRWSHALVVAEITFTLALLVVTASMVSGFLRSRSGEVGFDLDRFVGVSVQSAHPIPAAQLIDVIGRVPGVEAVSATTAVPLGNSGRRRPVSAAASGANGLQAEHISIGPDFFATLGVPMRQGRVFTPQETPLTRTVIISESLARQLFGGVPAAVGRQVWMDKVAHDVIGVVSDYMANPVESRAASPKVFVPVSDDAASPIGPTGSVTLRFLVRAAGDPAGLVEPVRRALRDASAGLSGGNRVFTLRQILMVHGQEYFAGTAPLIPLIVIGMLLTSSGIYGVLAFAVSRRSRELAVRVAIGAARGDQIRLVMMHGLRLVSIGSALGVALTFGLSRVVRAAGGAGTVYDPPWNAFVIPLLLVIVVAALATWIPIRRALGINPVLVLKQI